MIRPRLGQNKTPGAEGCGGSGTRAGAAPAGGTYNEAVTTRTDADRRAARRAAAWVQRRRRRSKSFGFLSMSVDTVATQIDRQGGMSADHPGSDASGLGDRR